MFTDDAKNNNKKFKVMIVNEKVKICSSINLSEQLLSFCQSVCRGKTKVTNDPFPVPAIPSTLTTCDF